MLCHFAHHVLFSKANTLFCSNGHALLFQVCPIKQNNLLMKCASGHTLSVLKPISFVGKWRCVVSVLSPLASKSYGGSHMSEFPICQKPQFVRCPYLSDTPICQMPLFVRSPYLSDAPICQIPLYVRRSYLSDACIFQIPLFVRSPYL